MTFVTSIPALALYQPVLDHPIGYLASGGQDNRIFSEHCWSCCSSSRTSAPPS